MTDDPARAAVAYWDTAERNVFATSAYARTVGTTPARLRGRTLAEVLGRRRYDLDRPAVRAALAGTADGPARYVPDVIDGVVVGIVELDPLPGTVPLTRPDTGAPTTDPAVLPVLDDRRRLAADLHDTVLQRLYATGLGLTRALFATGSPPDSPYLTAIEEIDAAVVELRAAIVAMQGEELAPAEARASIDRLVGHATRTLGFAPTVTYRGPVDAVPAPVVRHLLAVLSEALSNAARHAAARTVDIRLRVHDGRVDLEVADDGVGIPEGRRRSGITNMDRRAELLGGELVLVPRDPRGTLVRWSVPIPRDVPAPASAVAGRR